MVTWWLVAAQPAAERYRITPTRDHRGDESDGEAVLLIKEVT